MKAIAVAAISLATACFVGSPSEDGGADATVDAVVCPLGPDAGDLPCDVAAVFQAKCQHCHTTPKLAPPNNAPFPLRTYEDLATPFGSTGLARWQRAAQVIEPNNFPHMPLPTAPQLTQSDFDTLRAWFAACAPPVAEGTGCDVGERSSDAGDGGDAPDAADADALLD